MKAKELIYNLRTNLESVGSSLGNKTDQHLMYMLDEARAILASRKMDQRVNVIQMAQFVDVKLRTATSEEIGTVGYSRILVAEIPKPISYLNGGGIFTVGSTDGKKSYTEISFSQIRTLSGRKYTENSPKWLLLDDKIMVLNVKPPGIKMVRVRGIFDEPYKVIQVKGLYKKLDPFNWEYPLTFKDAGTIYQLAMDSDLGWGDTAAQAVQQRRSKQKKDNDLLSTLKKMSK